MANAIEVKAPELAADQTAKVYKLGHLESAILSPEVQADARCRQALVILNIATQIDDALLEAATARIEAIGLLEMRQWASFALEEFSAARAE